MKSSPAFFDQNLNFKYCIKQPSFKLIPALYMMLSSIIFLFHIITKIALKQKQAIRLILKGTVQRDLISLTYMDRPIYENKPLGF
jgi:hypothetical protein